MVLFENIPIIRGLTFSLPQKLKKKTKNKNTKMARTKGSFNNTNTMSLGKHHLKKVTKYHMYNCFGFFFFFLSYI